MYRIIDDRASGKTSRLMLIAKENNAVFVCSNPRAMEAKAHAYGIVGIEFIGYSQFLSEMNGQSSRKVVIDEMEVFLSHLLSWNKSQEKIIGYTLSLEED